MALGTLYLVIWLRQLCSKTLQGPSFGGGCVIPITVPYWKEIYTKLFIFAELQKALIKLKNDLKIFLESNILLKY